jgi:aryl-alcohol dehydrogenase-like predicted oxidoreductase
VPPSVPTRSLGRTGIQVTPIGLGVMQFSGSRLGFGAMFEELTRQQTDAIVRAALEGGINWFDTAELYGFGRSERRLAEGLKTAGRRAGEVVVATKWLPLLRTAGSIRRTIRQRLRHLDGFPIDLYQVHHPNSLSTPEAEMHAMADLVEAGLIRSVGVSNFDARRMERAHRTLERRGLPLAANQVEYSLVERSIETNGVLQAARDLGITIIAWSPTGRGLLTGKFHQHPARLRRTPPLRRWYIRRRMAETRPLVHALEAIGASHGASAAQVALNWLIHSAEETVVAIPGTSRAEQAADSAAAMRFRLSEEEFARLEELSRTYR